VRVNLTGRLAKSATTKARKSPIFNDDEVIGFGLQVGDNGRKNLHTRLHIRRPSPALRHRRLPGLERGAPIEAKRLKREPMPAAVIW
jgi:hypothetical protein